MKKHKGQRKLRSARTRHTILTDAKGKPFVRPLRSDFGRNVEGDIVFMRAVHAYNDRVTASANSSFVEAFRNGLRRR